MTLLLKLIARILAIVMLCLAGAAGWVMVDAHQTIVTETSATAERVGQHFKTIFWNRLVWRDGMTKPSLVPLSDWETIPTLNIISPGVCITFAMHADQPRQLCSKVDMIGRPAPEWFRALNDAVFASPAPVRQELSRGDSNPVIFYASVDREAALRLAWQQVSIVVGVAGVMAAAIALLAALTIGHALTPARSIIGGLRRLQTSDYDLRLPAFHSAEFNHIARALNELAQRLRRTTAERAALTTRLFTVQEDERAALARDLHDEFGQCLTGTLALATLIESKTSTGRPDVADDARAICRAQQRMMLALRQTLSRLRTQNIEEIGLEASLRELVATCNTQSVSANLVKLSLGGSLAAVPKQVGIGVYRIAQECITNAIRHGTPSEVRLRVANDNNDTIAVIVEDDGGGDVRRLRASPGYGLAGIRERIGSLGGSLVIARANGGVRIAATIPLALLRGGPTGAAA